MILLYRLFYLSLFLILLHAMPLWAQPVPGVDENISYLVTFGSDAKPEYGDDDYCQIFFFVIPKEKKEPFFIRVFDPDIGGKLDEIAGIPNTKVRFSVYGGKGAVSNPDAIGVDPVGQYKSGVLMTSKIFGNEPTYDEKWYSFGPFNPTEGELSPEYGGYVFKLITEGLTGDDGNLYKYFLSTSGTQNMPVEGGNFFTFEYTFRVHSRAGSVSHIYPFITEDVIAVKVNTFDFDNDGILRMVSVSKKGEPIAHSADNNWVQSIHKISAEEKKTSLDIQIIKLKEMDNNNMVLYITNQYDKVMPFYTAPIGGVPKYRYKIGVK